MDVELWKRSGHYDNYRENMYLRPLEEREFAVKPMNCPSHCMIYGSRKRSYRELRSATPTSAACTAPSARHAARPHARAQLRAGRRA
jgi:threonyl-tRNA synthetase